MPPEYTLRPAVPDDADALARGVIDGLAEYPAFAPDGWAPPAFASEAAATRRALADPDAWCLVAEVGGEIVGQISLLPATAGPRPVADETLAHVRNLFVDADHRGTGLARALDAAAADAARVRGFRSMRLFVAAGQARARAFYERAGWAPVGEPFHDPVPGLAMVEYRRAVPDRDDDGR
jgi:GNAT superfamily N-acetyltransferase